MTREEMLARRDKLLPIYQNPESDMQAVEVDEELRWLSDQLKRTRVTAEPRKPPKAWGGPDVKALAAGDA